MSDDAIIEVHIESEVRDRANEVLAQSGLTIDDAVRLLLTRTAAEGAIPLQEPPGYDAWYRARVQEALDDPRPAIPHEEVEAYFAKKRAELRAKIEQS